MSCWVHKLGSCRVHKDNSCTACLVGATSVDGIATRQIGVPVLCYQVGLGIDLPLKLICSSYHSPPYALLLGPPGATAKAQFWMQLFAGKKSLAMEAFARALRQLPTIICDNAGLDSADIVATLRAAHGADPESTHMGVDVIAGGAGDMSQLGIFESFRVKQQVCLVT